VLLQLGAGPHGERARRDNSTDDERSDCLGLLGRGQLRVASSETDTSSSASSAELQEATSTDRMILPVRSDCPLELGAIDGAGVVARTHESNTHAKPPVEVRSITRPHARAKARYRS
jgi:hypothetical protein